MPVTVSPVQPLQLAETWAELGNAGGRSYCHSIGWVSTWLASLPPQARAKLLRILDADKVVAATLMHQARRRTKLLLPTRRLHLWETGERQLDCLTWEGGDVFTASQSSVNAFRELLLWFRNSEFEELHVPALFPDSLKRLLAEAASAGIHSRVTQHKPYIYVDLAPFRGDPALFLDSLSSNTRYQIRRAMRLYERRGPLTLQAARSVPEALDFLGRLRSLHQAYWTGRGEPGAFAQPFFERFHRRLIEERLPHGEVELLQVRAGQEPLGYLYSFCWNGWVHAYQSGFAYEADAKLKPGLVSHYLAIGQHIRKGAAVYDFMAGDAQHKRSLASEQSAMTWCVLYKPTWKHRLEEPLRRLKRQAVRAGKAWGDR